MPEVAWPIAQSLGHSAPFTTFSIGELLVKESAVSTALPAAETYAFVRHSP